MGPTAYVSVGWESVPWKSADPVTFMVMENIIGNYKKNTGLVPGTISGNRTINAIANIGQQMLSYGRVVPAAEMVLRIDAVDAEEVKRVAWQYLNDGEIAVTALGPLHGMPQYMDLRRATMMHRY